VAPADALKSSPGRTGSGSREHRRLRATLVITEIALAVVLVVGAGLIVRSFWAIRSVEPGFAPENMLSLRYQLPPSRYPQSFDDYPTGWARIFSFQRELLERVEAIPGVRSAALAFNDPLSAGFTNSFIIEGRDPSAAEGQPEVPTRPASANYFATAGIPLLQGRLFTPSDDAGAPPVVIINEAMVRQFFANENPLGRRLTFWGVSREIVGVVGNERFSGLASEAAPAMYPPLAQAPATTGTLIVRTNGDPRAVLSSVRAAIRSIDRDLAPFGITTMGEALDASVAQQRFLAFLLTAFAALALVLALVGVYGVVSYSVAQRGREIGIRLALGADGRLVLRSVVGEGLRLAIAGCAIGVVAALGTSRLLRSQLFGVSATDPLTIVAAVATMVAVAVAASLVPAWRASTLPPAVVLRDS
jgi:putative ABC transport system permease protein